MILLLFLPPVVLLMGIPFLSLEGFWYEGGYMGLLYLTMGYLILGGFLLKEIYTQNRSAFGLAGSLFFAIALFCLLYFTNYILGIHEYITGPIAYALVVYVMSYFFFKNKGLLINKKQSKYQNLNITTEQVQVYSRIITKVMQEERPYLNGDFNLGVLSEKTKMPKHILSSVFSMAFKKSFPDFTNTYRIEEAMKLLNDEGYKNKKIESIAYDCGFNSISAFNSSFKRINRCSPSEYKKRLLRN